MTPRPKIVSPPLLTPAEVGALFRVDPKTVTRWAKAGKLTSIRTLGGHRRYSADQVYGLLNDGAVTTTPTAPRQP
jgi:excisionase family DNA binding protein